MITQSHTIPHTTSQQMAAANARCLLESEPLPQFTIASSRIYCPNPDAQIGLRKWIAEFTDGNGRVSSYDGEHWNKG